MLPIRLKSHCQTYTNFRVQFEQIDTLTEHCTSDMPRLGTVNRQSWTAPAQPLRINCWGKHLAICAKIKISFNIIVRLFFRHEKIITFDPYAIVC